MGKTRRLDPQNVILHEIFMRQKETQFSLDRAQNEFLKRQITLLQSRSDLLAGVAYLAKGKRFNPEGSEYDVWTHEAMAALLDKDPHHWISGKFLSDLQMVLPDLIMTNWNWMNGKARQIICDGMTPEIIAGLDEQFDLQRVYVLSQKTMTARKQAQAIKEMKETLKDVQRVYWQLDVMAEYLHNRNPKVFADLCAANWRDAYELAAGYKNRKQYEAMMMSVKEVPMVFYPPTITDNPLLARLYSTELGNIPSPMRRAFFKDLPEADLRSLHASLLAWMFPRLMPETKSLLASQGKLWAELIGYMKVPEEFQKETKDTIIKPLWYSLQYGREEEYAREVLNRQLLDDPKRDQDKRGYVIPFQKDFFEHPYVKELIVASKALQKKIRKERGIEGAFDFLKWNEAKMNIKAFAANALQTFEIALIYPVYELAINQEKQNHETFEIILHQHDGFTPLFKSGHEEKAKKQIVKAVQEKISFYGMLTGIEFK